MANDPKLVKLLEKKTVIQIFGIGLILAPFVNIFLIMNGLPEDYPLKWSIASFIQIFSAGVLFQRVLNIASIGIGFFLLKGSKHAWKAVLTLLGGYILMQVTYLGQNFKQHPGSVVFFIVNVGLFLFIADQLAFKQKVPVPKAPIKPELKPEQKTVAKTPEPKPLTALAAAPVTAVPRLPRIHTRDYVAKIVIKLEGFGVWAQLASISTEGIEVKCLGPIPQNMEDRLIEFTLPTGVQMRAKLSRTNQDHFYFQYLNLSTQQKSDLGQWILTKAA